MDRPSGRSELDWCVRRAYATRPPPSRGSHRCRSAQRRACAAWTPWPRRCQPPRSGQLLQVHRVNQGCRASGCGRRARPARGRSRRSSSDGQRCAARQSPTPTASPYAHAEVVELRAGRQHHVQRDAGVQRVAVKQRSGSSPIAASLSRHQVQAESSVLGQVIQADRRGRAEPAVHLLSAGVMRADVERGVQRRPSTDTPSGPPPCGVARRHRRHVGSGGDPAAWPRTRTRPRATATPSAPVWR